MYTIQSLSASDAVRIAEIFEQALDDGNISLESQAPTWTVWDRTHLEYCRFGCYDSDGVLVGYAALRPYSSRDVYSGVVEMTLYVDRAHQGAGVGTRLIQKIIDCAESYGIWTLGAVIFECNARSIRLFNKHGFRTVGVRERIGKDKNGIWQNVVIVERRSDVVGVD